MLPRQADRWDQTSMQAFRIMPRVALLSCCTIMLAPGTNDIMVIS